ncbi:unnamed protein product, partial [Rotaria socialis]
MTTMNLDVIDISLVFGLRLPCAAIEYENIRNIRKKLEESDQPFSSDHKNNYDLSHLAQIYKSDDEDDKLLQIIFNEKPWFQLYFHDQI